MGSQIIHTPTHIKSLMEKQAISLAEAFGGAVLGQSGYDAGAKIGDKAGVLLMKIPAAIALKKGRPNLALRLEAAGKKIGKLTGSAAGTLAGAHVGATIGGRLSKKIETNK